MKRILLLVVAFAIAAVPGFAAGAVMIAPATTTTASVNTTSMKTTTTTATTPTVTTASVATTGNGAPSGSHFNLNIIGVPKDKTADMNNNDGHRIFVELVGGNSATSISGTDFSTISKVNKIFLVPAPPTESFQVLDANATDQNGALFQLPADVSTAWTVWARALGKPGGKADMTTCATTNVTVTDPITGVTTTTTEVLCSLTTTLHLVRTKNAKFQNVTSSLLFVTLSAADQALTTCTKATVALFDSCLQNYFWNYDNHGLKLLQLRFYPAATIPL